MTTLAIALLLVAFLGTLGRRQRAQRRKQAMRDLPDAIFPGIRGRIILPLSGKVLILDDEVLALAALVIL
jgi:hypothetical protein